MPADFLFNPGTNGFTVTPFNLLSTELNSLAIGATALSSVGGTSGVFTQSNTGNALMGEIYFSAGGGVTPVVGGYFAGWFLTSPDGTTFEKYISGTPPSRGADFIIPLYAAAYSSGEFAFSNGILVPLPAAPFKTVLQNQSGVALPGSGNLIKLGPVAVRTV